MSTETSTERIVPRAQPYIMTGGRIGILCIHGLGGTGDDFRSFATLMQQRKWTVSVMRVAGHGSTPDVLGRTTPVDWQASVDAALAEMRSRVDELFLLGASFGGALALDAARRHAEVVRGVIVVNTPLAYRVGGGLQFIGLKILSLFSSTFPKPGLSADQKAHYAESGSLTAWPISAILQSRAFMSNVVRPRLREMRTPLLVLRNADDPYVDPKNADIIARLYGGNVTTRQLSGRTHRPFRDAAQVAEIIAAVLGFLNNCEPR